MRTTTIYDLSPTLRREKDLAFVKILGLLIEESGELHFNAFLVIEPFLMYMVKRGRKQVVLRWGADQETGSFLKNSGIILQF